MNDDHVLFFIYVSTHSCKYHHALFTQSELSDTMKEKIRAEYLAVGGAANKPLSSNYFLNIIIGISVIAILTKLAGGF